MVFNQSVVTVVRLTEQAGYQMFLKGGEHWCRGNIIKGSYQKCMVANSGKQVV